jgi:glycosyltransferase involved in cell wall biosynthesis
VITYDAQALADQLKRLLSDQVLLASSRQKARQLAEQYDWEKLFNNAFQRR